MPDPVLPIRPPGEHPTPDQLYRARRGPRTAEAERWLSHAVACAVCTEELMRQEAFDAPEPVAARRLAAAWERFGESAESPRSRARRRMAWPRAGLALAAMLAVALLGVGVWARLYAPEGANGLLRGGTQTGMWRPSGLLIAPPAEFVFPVPPGETRRVFMHDASRHYTWTSPPTSDGRVPFPAAERQRLQKGVDYYWTVVDDSGAEAQKFRVQ